MILPHVVFVAAKTHRSECYARAMRAAGIAPERVIMYDQQTRPTAASLKRLHPRLIIFAGLPGEIVSDKLLAVGPWLHVHGGWLPTYRGSTILYYSILKEGRCGASAILLSSQLDEGVIVKRRHYPKPRRGEDTDYNYDNTMRADLLVRVLKEYQRDGGFRKTLKNDSSRGMMYYIIHPVLKHKARLSIEK